MNIRLSAFAMLLAVGAALAIDPRLEQGARFVAQGEFEKALGEYSAILADQPQNSDAYFAAAEVRLKMKDYSRAIANYRLAYKFAPAMSEAYEGAAKVYEILGQKGKADAERAKDPKNRPAEEPVAAVPAEAAPAEAPASQPAPAETPVAQPETPAAQPAAPVAEAPKAEPAEVKTETAVAPAPAAPVAEAPKTEAKAEAPAEKVAAAEPAKEPVKAEAPKAEEPKAEAKVETPAELPKDPFERGKALFAEGKFKEAAPLWREVLSKQPGHAGAYFYAGVTRYELGEMEKAEFNLKKGLDYKEDGNDANYYLACVYQKTNRQEQEKKSLAAYLKKAAPDGKFRKQAEARLEELNKPAEVVAEPAKEEVADAAKTEDAQVAESAAVARDSGKAAPAPAVVVAPGEESVAAANQLFKSGDMEKALQMYRGLLEKELSPDDRYFAILQMGNIYREMRDFHSAVTRYREVVQQFPDSDWATQAERALEDAVWLEKHAAELPRKKR